MTELPPEGAEVAAAPAAQKRKKKPPLFFHASIRCPSPVRVTAAGAELQLGGAPLMVNVAEQTRRALEKQPPESGRPYLALLWFRTPEGYVQELELGKVFPIKEQEGGKPVSDKPLFSVGARLKAVDREEGFLVVDVEPNTQGALAEAFEVRIWAALDLLDRLPKLGRTLIVTGEYRPQSGRLVATRSTPVHIGEPKSQPKPKTT